jgi:hypothetical protein
VRGSEERLRSPNRTVSGRRTRAICLAALGLATTTLLVLASCLPDLSAFPSRPDAGESDGSVQATVTCGDGVIETLDDGGNSGEACDPADAAVSGCKDCQIMCAGTLSEAGHCYFWTDSTGDYTVARAACEAADGHIVTFASQREVDFVATIAADAGYWVGLSDRTDRGGYAPPGDSLEPGWPRTSNACPGCFALGADDGGAFTLYPEDAGNAARLCLVSENGVWLQTACAGTTKHATLCEREPVGQRVYPCGGLFCTTLAVSAGRKRYVVWQFLTGAKEAKSLCESTYDGGRLVMIDSNEEREQLVREIGRILSPVALDGGTQKVLDLWIGLSRDNGVWTWDDGQVEGTDGGRPRPWAELQPADGGDRAFVRIIDTRFDTQLVRSEEDTSAQRMFVCERPIE